MSSDATVRAETSGAKYTITSLSEQPELSDQHQITGGSAWPEFMLHDPIAIANWEKMMTYFAGDQLSMLVDNQIAAVINMAPINVESDLTMLPDEGVDWGVEKSVADHERGIQPNSMLGLQVVVSKTFRGRNLSVAATREMIEHAKKRNCDYVLLPVRPSGKHAYPLISMEQYISWENSSGLPLDGWLRVHKRLGGKIIRICHRSMTIPGTIAKWENWTGQKFPGSGQYIVPFALNPIDIDTEQNTGHYVEPNIWVVHHVK